MGQHCVPGAGLEYHVEWGRTVCLEQVLSIMLDGYCHENLPLFVKEKGVMLMHPVYVMYMCVAA